MERDSPLKSAGTEVFLQMQHDAERLAKEIDGMIAELRLSSSLLSLDDGETVLPLDAFTKLRSESFQCSLEAAGFIAVAMRQLHDRLTEIVRCVRSEDDMAEVESNIARLQAKRAKLLMRQDGWQIRDFRNHIQKPSSGREKDGRKSREHLSELREIVSDIEDIRLSIAELEGKREAFSDQETCISDDEVEPMRSCIAEEFIRARERLHRLSQFLEENPGVKTIDPLLLEMLGSEHQSDVDLAEDVTVRTIQILQAEVSRLASFAENVLRVAASGQKPKERKRRNAKALSSPRGVDSVPDGGKVCYDVDGQQREFARVILGNGISQIQWLEAVIASENAALDRIGRVRGFGNSLDDFRQKVIHRARSGEMNADLRPLDNELAIPISRIANSIMLQRIADELGEWKGRGADRRLSSPISSGGFIVQSDLLAVLGFNPEEDLRRVSDSEKDILDAAIMCFRSDAHLQPLRRATESGMKYAGDYLDHEQRDQFYGKLLIEILAYVGSGLESFLEEKLYDAAEKGIQLSSHNRLRILTGMAMRARKFSGRMPTFFEDAICGEVSKVLARIALIDVSLRTQEEMDEVGKLLRSLNQRINAGPQVVSADASVSKG